MYMFEVNFNFFLRKKKDICIIDHRKHGNRIIKEFLLGKKLTNYINNDTKKSFE